MITQSFINNQIETVLEELMQTVEQSIKDQRFTPERYADLLEQSQRRIIKLIGVR